MTLPAITDFNLEGATGLRTASSPDHFYFTGRFENGTGFQCWHWPDLPDAPYTLEAHFESMIVDLNRLTLEEVNILLGLIRRRGPGESWGSS